jgi:hypothetical protein
MTLRPLLIAVLLAGAAQAHDIITTPITWSREISRIVYARCASCHHEGGRAFSLMTYKDARPWAVAIRDEVLRRSMPPWGAIKGFGDFRNDQGLTPEEFELIVSWSDGGVPEGEPADLPASLPKFDAPPIPDSMPGEIVASGDLQLTRVFTLGGLVPRKVPAKVSFQMTAELPDGSILPLLWLENYKPAFGHPFILRTDLELPARTVIRGIPPGASVALLPHVPLPEPPPPVNMEDHSAHTN